MDLVANFQQSSLFSKSFKIWLLILILLLIDRGTKYVFYDLKIGESLFFLTPVFNKGISRGIAIDQTLIWIISIVGIWFFSFLYCKKTISTRVFLLLMAGTIGNFVDRVFLGGVRDFVSLGTSPVFNIADCYLTFAVIFLIKKEIFPCNLTSKK